MSEAALFPSADEAQSPFDRGIHAVVAGDAFSCNIESRAVID
jgi:hypothetical protein